MQIETHFLFLESNCPFILGDLVFFFFFLSHWDIKYLLLVREDLGLPVRFRKYSLKETKLINWGPSAGWEVLKRGTMLNIFWTNEDWGYQSSGRTGREGVSFLPCSLYHRNDIGNIPAPGLAALWCFTENSHHKNVFKAVLDLFFCSFLKWFLSISCQVSWKVLWPTPEAWNWPKKKWLCLHGIVNAWVLFKIV